MNLTTNVQNFTGDNFKTCLKDTKVNLNKYKTPLFIDGTALHHEDVNSPRVTHKFNTFVSYH